MRRTASFTLLLFGLIFVQSAAAQKEVAIDAIQGNSNVSPMVGQKVSTSGIVTARVKNGFYIQTPDDKVDNDPKTSEGIFVYTMKDPTPDASVGTLISVIGIVQEFRPRAEPDTLPITQISVFQDTDKPKVISKDAVLPKPIDLTADMFNSNALDALERFEGMRVHASELLVSAPTKANLDEKNEIASSTGVFYGVLNGLPMPFREPGYDRLEIAFSPQKEREEFVKKYPQMRMFDGNPERLRIDSAGQEGSTAIDIQAKTVLRNIVGVLTYGYRTWTIQLDPKPRPSVVSMPTASNMPTVPVDQFSVAGMNIESFFDDVDDPGIKELVVTSDAFAKRLNKISLAIRNVVKSPDIIGCEEIEGLAALKKLAEKLNADTVAAGGKDPKYEAFLIEGNDGRGIDNGFLIKTSRVKVNEIKQFGKDEKFDRPDGGNSIFLNDRPPLMLRATVMKDGVTGKTADITVIVNHLKSYGGFFDPKQQAMVRMKKRLQAEYLARLVQDRQKADANEKILLVGDFNSFQFSDGILDQIGTIKGTPSPEGQVEAASPDLVDPDLTDAVDLIAAEQRYSYRYDGNAQVLDHFLINKPLLAYLKGFGYARVNADFPGVYRTDANRPEGYSDHDIAIGYFGFDPKGTK